MPLLTVFHSSGGQNDLLSCFPVHGMLQQDHRIARVDSLGETAPSAKIALAVKTDETFDSDALVCDWTRIRHRIGWTFTM